MNEKAVCGNEEARDSPEGSPPSNSPETVYLEKEEDSDSKVPAVTVNLAAWKDSSRLARLSRV